MLNKQKIAFITCVNDEAEYAECRYYLDRLHVPDGYFIDMLCIRDAPSMVAGYNAGMRDSDAKYKVYLHQDVFMKNIYFISDMLKIFASDEQIGMMGVIGKKKIGTTLTDMLKPLDTGNVIYNNVIMGEKYSGNEGYAEVEMADGLLLATQYDIPWREDVFDGWDFYDVSQCLEFQKMGYKVVVPSQKKIWCCHDGVCLELAKFFDHYKQFRYEYAGMLGGPTDMNEEEVLLWEENKDYVQKIGQLKQCMAALFDIGERNGLRQVFQNPDLEKEQYLTEYRSIVWIDWMEEQEKEKIRFWKDGMTVSQLIAKLHVLKFALKRIEYGVDETDVLKLQGEYSEYAIREVCFRYVTFQERVYRKLGIEMCKDG